MKPATILLWVCGLVFLSGGLEAKAGSDPIVIGLQGPITGAWAYEGQMARQACETAAALINQKGGHPRGKKNSLAGGR